MSAAGSDARASAPAITVGDTSAATNANGFTMAAGEKVPVGYEDSVYRSAWWKIDPSPSKWIKLDTELSGSGNDTVIGVWADVSGTLVEVASDDDSGGTYRTSKLDFYGYSTFTYYVQVTNYDDISSAPYVLRCSASTVTDTPPPPPELPPDPPANDNRADAIEIAVGDTSTVDGTSATMEPGERWPSAFSYRFYRSAWWFIEPTTDDWVQVDTELGGEDTDTRIAVWADMPWGLVQVGYDDDSGDANYTSKLTFYGYSDIKYYVQVGSYEPGGAITYALRAQAGTSTDPIPPRPPAPAANDDFADAATITYGTSTAPTTTSGMTLEAGEPTWADKGTLWWKFTPTVSGIVGVDLLQTEIPDPAATTYYDTATVYVYTGTAISDLAYVAGGSGNEYRDPTTGANLYGTLPAFDVNVTGGVTYWIQVLQASYQNDLDLVLRVGPAFHSYGEWVQPPDQVTTFSGGDPFAPDPVWTVEGEADWYGLVAWRNAFEGKKTLSKGFGAPQPDGWPGMNPDAIDCAWRGSRRALGTDHYWTPGNAVEWNAGPGQCPPYPTGGRRMNTGFSDHPIGFSYHSSSHIPAVGGGYQDCHFRVYGGCFTITVKAVMNYLSPSGLPGGDLEDAPYYPTLAPGDRVEWEGTYPYTPELTNLEIQPTEPVAQTHDSAEKVKVDWFYSASCRDKPSDPGAARFGTYDGQWGPRWDNASTSQGPWWTTYDGPEVFSGYTVTDDWGTRTREIPLASNWAGEVVGWQPVDPVNLEKARAIEAEQNLPGLRFVGIPVKSYVDSKPTDLSASYGLVGSSTYAYRSDGGVAFRATIRPPRYRIISLKPETQIVDLLMKNTSIRIVDDATGEPEPFARAAAASGAEGAEQELVLTATWAQRYSEDTKQIPAEGVSQGVLSRDATGDPSKAGPGNERSLVGFDTSELPDDAYIVEVRLKTRWTRWLYPQGVGSLMLGWHDQEEPPKKWTVGTGDDQLSEHDIKSQDVDLSLSWLAGQTAGNFHGLAVGPGWNDGGLYAGMTTADTSEWQLLVRYRVDT